MEQSLLKHFAAIRDLKGLTARLFGDVTAGVSLSTMVELLKRNTVTPQANPVSDMSPGCSRAGSSQTGEGRWPRGGFGCSSRERYGSDLSPHVANWFSRSVMLCFNYTVIGAQIKTGRPCCTCHVEEPGASDYKLLLLL